MRWSRLASLGVLIVSLGGAPFVRGEGQIGVYGIDGTTVIYDTGDIPQAVFIIVEGLQQPASRLEFSLPLPGEFFFVLPSGHQVASSDLVVEFDGCADLSGRRLVADGQGYWLTDPPRTDTVVCLGPHGDPSVPATGPIYRACDGTWHAIGLAENPGWDLDPGCARMYSSVPTQESSWSTIKVRF